ncbi:hypothetical protein NU10_09825 [Flavobacterium dauae]|uniref:hypothetical protein n=1 Tax=Flavobacterium dauae TaxID=1563479 RepID=UPI00101B3D87|nr:hypothetical protein [Flavobacterium dauae]WLD23012.1 hypothetical protein NU10_09825 [Flavobacterium dauae]
MRYFYLLIIVCALGCQPKEDKPELDFVNIEMFPALGGPPSNIRVDLKNKLLIFSNLQHIGTYNENCEEEMNKITRPVEFVYINLNEEELKIVNTNLNNDFLKSVMKSNQDLIDNPKLYDDIRYDGVVFEIDFVKENKVFSTDEYLILEREDNIKILQILRIIQKHSTLKINKDYIENVSFYLE